MVWEGPPIAIEQMHDNEAFRSTFPLLILIRDWIFCAASLIIQVPFLSAQLIKVVIIIDSMITLQWLRETHEDSCHNRWTLHIAFLSLYNKSTLAFMVTGSLWKMWIFVNLLRSLRACSCCSGIREKLRACSEVQFCQVSWFFAGN